MTEAGAPKSTDELEVVALMFGLPAARAPGGAARRIAQQSRVRSAAAAGERRRGAVSGVTGCLSDATGDFVSPERAGSPGSRGRRPVTGDGARG